MSLDRTSTRPVHLNLLKVHLPVPGVMSIVHRITGVLLFLALPVLVYLLGWSLDDATGFAAVRSELHRPLGTLLLFLLLWSLFHHLLAGIRYLLIDADLGVDRRMARTTAWMVLLAAPLVALLLTWGLL